MKKLVRHLRGQPEEVRRHVLHGFVFVVGFILIVLWIYSLGMRISDERTQEEIADEFDQLSPSLEANTEIPALW